MTMLVDLFLILKTMQKNWPIRSIIIGQNNWSKRSMQKL